MKIGKTKWEKTVVPSVTNCSLLLVPKIERLKNVYKIPNAIEVLSKLLLPRTVIILLTMQINSKENHNRKRKENLSS